MLLLSLLAAQRLASVAAAEGPAVSAEAKSAFQIFMEGFFWKQASKGEPAPMKVIGAGFGRTGSNSLMIALEQLGYKTYHMEKAMKEDHIDDWSLIHAGEGKQDDSAFERVLDAISTAGYTAGVDFPICLAYKELMRRNPDSPVILSTRTSPEAWAKSYIDTIDRLERASARQQPPLSFLMPGMYNMSLWTRWKIGLSWGDLTIEEAAAVYSKWLEEVKANVPKEKLLIWKVQDGWEPICAHLKVPKGQCPSDRGESFPRGKNDTADMQFAAWALNFAMDWFHAIVVVFVLFVLFVLRLLCKCCCRGKVEKEKEG